MILDFSGILEFVESSKDIWICYSIDFIVPEGEIFSTVLHDHKQQNNTFSSPQKLNKEHM